MKMTINQVAGAHDPLPLTPNLPEHAKPATPVATTNVETAAIPVSEAQVRDAVSQIQKFTYALAQNLQFAINEDTGKMVIKIVDGQTREMIRQMPSEEAVSIARTLDRIQGLLFSDKA
jgi:flagellar protein FlaG